MFEAGHIDAGLSDGLLAALEEGAEIHLMRSALPEAGTRCRVLDVAQAIGPGGLEADYLVASVDAAARDLGDGMLVVAGLGAAVLSLGLDYASDSGVAVGAALAALVKSAATGAAFPAAQG
ncbi:MAG: hypothetical protein RIM80_19945, partial [Alphaproteobacteria bacterium]